MVLTSFLTVEVFLSREIFLKKEMTVLKKFATIRKGVVFLDRRACSLCKVDHVPHGLGKPGILQKLDLV